MKNDREACKEDLFITSFSVKVTHHNEKIFLITTDRLLKLATSIILCFSE